MTHSIVFGGTKGLGRVVARLFAQRGDAVSVISRGVPAEAARLAGVRYLAADIADAQATQSALDAALSVSGAPNYLVFCQRYRGKDDPWVGEIEVSLTAPRRVVDALAARFAKGADCGIVFVSSVFGDRVGEGQPLSYHLGKSGMNHMARFYAVNLARKGVRANVITPFTFLKDESKDFYLDNRDLLALYEEIIPLGRMATAEDSAQVIAFLCSPAAGFVNGQNIYVDGGLSLVWPETLARKLKGM
jgi:NAD(P)-dependent dehydrogenase (short-subunit alcohol dehydrogenase family)